MLPRLELQVADQPEDEEERRELLRRQPEPRVLRRRQEVCRVLLRQQEVCRMLLRRQEEQLEEIAG